MAVNMRLSVQVIKFTMQHACSTILELPVVSLTIEKFLYKLQE